MRRNTRLGIIALAALLAMLTLPAQAHTRKGTLELQGSFAFSSSSGDLYGNENLTQVDFFPAIHYFVANHFGLGGRLQVQSSKQGDVSSTSFGLGPSVQYFFGGLDDRTQPYVGADVLVRSISTKVNNHSSDHSGSSIGLAVGLAHFFREHLAITPELSVNFESLGGSTGTTVLVGVGLAGFLY